MKALSIHQPWANLIVYGAKKVENRSRRTHYRGPVIIHAAIKWDMDATDWLMAQGLYDELMVGPLRGNQGPFYQEGGFIGTAQIVDCVENSESPFFVGPFGWVLSDTKPIDFIPYKGQLGLFNVPDSVLEGIKI